MKKIMFFIFLCLISCAKTVDINRAKGKEGPLAPDIADENVTFHLLMPEATKVTVAGNFNGWNKMSNVLKKDINGIWEITLPIAVQDRILYVFYADGYTLADPDNPNTTSDGGSGIVSVLETHKENTK